MKFTLTVLAALMFVGVSVAPTEASARSIWQYSNLQIEKPSNIGFAWVTALRQNRFDWRLPSFYTAPREFVRPLRSEANFGRRRFVWAGATVTMTPSLVTTRIERDDVPTTTQRPIPEPGAALAFGAGLLVTGAAWRRRR